ncbi:hypothetical protein [Pseudooceanicola sp. 200-1SW]|uniref:hypothetical protein n=1 Tax=Pseudooceanicola sp. 200-1SW TaxID=3425949 RepID=UPI003D7F784D
MSEAIRAAAQQTRQQIEDVAALELPEPSPADSPLALEAVSDAFAEQIRARMAALDIDSPQTLARFGSAEEEALVRILREMRRSLTEAAPGRLTAPLTDLATVLASAPPPAPGRAGGGLWRRLRPLLTRRAAGAAGRGRLGPRPAETRRQLDRLAGDLLVRHRALLARIRTLDLLYEQGLDHYDELALVLAAGQERLRLAGAARPEGTSRALPPAPACAALAARLEALSQTRRQIARALPPVRLAQEGDKALLRHLSDLLTRALPLGPSAPGARAAQHDHCLSALIQGQALAEDSQERHSAALDGLNSLIQALSPPRSEPERASNKGASAPEQGARAHALSERG